MERRGLRSGGDHAPISTSVTASEKYGGKPQLETGTDAWHSTKSSVREKHPVVEDPRGFPEKANKDRKRARDQAAAIQCGNRLMMFASIGPKKKGYPEVPFCVAWS